MTTDQNSIVSISCFVCSIASFLPGQAPAPVMAQELEPIVPDASLGGERSQLQRNVNVRGALGDRVTGGAVRGQNLFHSFERFNVEADQRVYFSNPVEIENILGRITGLEPSAINGLLGVDGSADLFLINPNGIVFGPNARLDVDGSFTASTAAQFDLGSGQVFSARDANAAPWVTVNIPVGLQFIGEQAPARLENAAQLAAGKDLTLVAGEVVSSGDVSATNGKVQLNSVSGDLQVQGLEADSAELLAKRDLILNNSQLRTTQDLLLQAEDVVQARDSAEAPFIADAGGKLTIQAEEAIDILALSHPQTLIQSGSDLRLSSDGVVSGDAHFNSGGDFAIATMAGQPGEFVSLYDPIFRITDNYEAGDYTGAALKVEAGGSIRMGDLRITSPDTPNSIPDSDPDFALLTERPSLILRAGVAVTNPTDIGTFPADSPANLTVGNIDTSIGTSSNLVSAGAVILSAPGSIEGGDIMASSTDAFNDNGIAVTGGEVEITAGENLKIGNIDTSSRDGISLLIPSFLSGGGVTLSALGSIEAGNIRTSGFSTGVIFSNGGAVNIAAAEGLKVGTIVTTASTNSGAGALQAGAVNLNAGGDLQLSAINTSTTGGANDSIGGAVNLSALGSITGGNLLTFASNNRSSGRLLEGGSVDMTAGKALQVGSFVTSAVSDANNLEVSQAGSVNLKAGSDILFTTITAVIERGSIRGTSAEIAEGGSVILSAPGSITGGEIATSVEGVANSTIIEGGAVEITAGEELQVGEIKTSALGIVSSTSIKGGVVEIKAGKELQVGAIRTFARIGDLGDSDVDIDVSGLEELQAGAVNLTAGGNLLFAGIVTEALGNRREGVAFDTGNGGDVGISAAGLVQGTDTSLGGVRTIRTEGENRSGTVKIAHDGGLDNIPFIVGDASVNGLDSSISAFPAVVESITPFPNPGTETRGPAGEIQITFNNTAPTLSATTETLASKAGEPISFTLAELGVTTRDVDNDNLILELAGNGQGSLSRGGNILSVGEPISLTDTLTYTPLQDFAGTTELTIRSNDGLEASEVAIAISVEPLVVVKPPKPPEQLKREDLTRQSTPSSNGEILFVDTQASSVASLAVQECDADELDSKQIGDRVLAIESQGGVSLPPTASFLLAAEAESLDWVELNMKTPDVVDAEFSEKEAAASSLETEPTEKKSACRTVIR